MTLDGTGELALSQWQGLTDGGVNIIGGNYSPTSGTASSDNSFASLSDIKGSGLSVSGGGSLTLPAVTRYDPHGLDIAFSASGSGALLDLPNLASVSRSTSGGGTSYSSGFYSRGRLDFTATGGGQVQAPSLTSITAGYEETAVGAQARGAGSLVNLSGVTTFITYSGLFSATQDGTVLLNSGLTSLESARITVDGGTGGIINPTDTSSLDQFTALNYDSIQVEGGQYNLPNLTNIDNTSISVSGGGSLTIPKVGTYTNSEYYDGTYLTANDTTSGGTLALPGLTTISGTYVVHMTVAGSNSAIDLPALTSWTTGDGYYDEQSTLSVIQGGTLDDGNLTTPGNLDVTLDGTGKLAVSQWTSLTSGSIRITGGDYCTTSGAATSQNSFTNLSDIDGSGLYVSGDGSLTLSEVKTYTNNDVEDTVFQVTDTTVGGTLDLPALTGISGYYGVTIQATGSKSQVELPALTSITATYEGYAALSVTQAGTVDDPLLTALTDVNVTLDGTGTIAVSPWKTLTDGSLEITSGDYAPTSGAATPSNSFTNLSDINGSALLVSGGGSLSLPDVTTYQALDDPYVFSQYGNVFEANGTSSTLSLPGLASISESGYDYAPFTIEAQGSGQVELAALTSINTSGYDAPVSVESGGAGSLIDVSALTTYVVVDSNEYDGAILSATNSGAVELSSQLTSLEGVKLTLDGTGTIPIGQFTSITSGGITVEAGDYATGTPFENVTDIDGSSLDVYGGGSLDLPGVKTYTSSVGGTSFQAYGESNVYPYTNTVGTLSLLNLTSITGALGIAAQGNGSEVRLPLVTSLGGGSLSVTQQGTVLAPELTTLSDVNVTLDGTGTIATSQWTSLTDGTLTITAGNYSSTTSPPFASLSDIDGSSVYVYGGGSLTLPAVTSYTNDTDGYEYLQADQYTDYNYSNGSYYGSGSVGVLSLPVLTTISGENVLVLTGGTGSAIDLPALTSFMVNYHGYLSVTDQATLVLPNTTAFVNVTITTDSTASFTVASGQTISFPAGTSTINTGTVVDQGSMVLGRSEAFTLANYPNGGTGIIQTPVGEPVQSQLVRHPGQHRRPDGSLHSDQFSLW